jgi:hypothetical protein
VLASEPVLVPDPVLVEVEEPDAVVAPVDVVVVVSALEDVTDPPESAVSSVPGSPVASPVASPVPPPSSLDPTAVVDPSAEAASPDVLPVSLAAASDGTHRLEDDPA